MTYDEWTPRYRRLVKTYGKTENGEQCSAYFEALAQFSEGVIEQAIAKHTAEDKYWPAAADLRTRCLGILAGAVYTPPACPQCHGNKFIEAPDQTHFNRSYAYVRRCPTCNTKRAEVA
jgi:hypothetical protein